MLLSWTYFRKVPVGDCHGMPDSKGQWPDSDPTVGTTAGLTVGTTVARQ